MKKSQILTGEELVAKGATKLDVCLPELGIKDVIPNGSWLEQKQIQSAVEARKHLIEVPRIEKCGVLSHANWNEDLGLAEVTQQVGGYWQWLGHHEQNQLYLNPEEALYLIETNCLQLKYNEVTVSLQQAYSLLLRGKITLLQYKVYASLSRVGYKVLRHVRHIDNEDLEEELSKDVSTNDSSSLEVNNETELVDKVVELNDVYMNIGGVSKQQENPNESKESEIKTEIVSRKDIKLQNLMKRLYKVVNRKKNDNLFENIPDLYQKQLVTLNVPEETYLPRNVFLNHTSYLLNIENVRTVSHTSSDTGSYNFADVNEAHIRRIRSSSQHDTASQNSGTPPNYTQNSFPRFQQFWPSGQRHRQNRQYHFNYFFQRPFPQQMYFLPRYQTWPRQQIFCQRQTFCLNDNNSNQTENRKRTRNEAKQTHLSTIKQLIENLKHLILRGGVHPQYIQPLQRLISTFNIRYKTKIRLTDEFKLVNVDDINIDTIVLDDDDDEPKIKISKSNNSFQENYKALKDLAEKLKDLDSQGKACSRQRRAFSSLISTFNKCYNSEVHCDNNYEVTNRNHIDLDSSDSDCVLESTENNFKSKTFINPFNVIRKQAPDMPSTSKENNNITENESKYTEISKVFKKVWLPGEDDFGRPEVISNKAGFESIADSKSEEFLFEFIKDYNTDYRNWIDIKMSFWDTIDETPNVSQNESNTDSTLSPNSLVKPGDCKDMTSLLQLLRIIPTCETTAKETYLGINFDVYNRDVPNFKKSDKPTPHFRIVCIDENSSLPAGEEIATLHSQYKDGVPIVFAIVSIGSISYLQMKPTNLPVYIPSNDIL